METQNSITLSDITNLLEQGAVLRYQEQWHLVWGPFQASAEPINQDISIYCPDFYDSQKGLYLNGERFRSIDSEGLSDLLESFLHSQGVSLERKALAEASWLEPSLENYTHFFQDVQSKIQHHEIRKAVPVVFAKAKAIVNATERALMLYHLLQAPSSLYIYGLWDDGKGILGATPEVLFRKSGTVIQTMALAGTCPKSEVTQRPNLLADPKEREEHEFVIQDLREILSPLGSLQQGETKLLELPTLWHLQTDLAVEVSREKTPSLISLVQRMHPTPALGVFPRSAGFHWMQGYADQEQRGRFGGPFLFAFPRKNEALCLVAIRNLQWNKDQVMLGSGAGVVAASEVMREWRELAQKRDSVKKLLGVK